MSCLPETSANRALISALAEHHYTGQIALVARDEADSDYLQSLGSVEIVLPFNQAADFTALDIAARIASSESNKTQEPP